MPTIINSTNLESVTPLLPSFVFTFDADGETHTVSDKDLNSEEAVHSYAVKKFLTEGMDIQTIVVKSYPRVLNINDIISISLPEYKIPIDLSKHRFIVTSKIGEYKGGISTESITGVRYD